MFDDGFDRDTASATDEAVRRVLQFGETVGTLTKNNLLDTGLAIDWIWFAGLWARVGPAALRQREKFGVASLYENFEALTSGSEMKRVSAGVRPASAALLGSARHA